MISYPNKGKPGCMTSMEFESNPDDPRRYRNALGRFGTGVALVAALDGEGAARAITINSFASISLVPRITSWAIDDASDRHALFTGCAAYSINILSHDQETLARRFTRKAEALIDANDLDMVDGVPCVRGVLCRLRCTVLSMQVVGDHTVVFGSVTGFDDFGPGDGLGYFNGGYVRLTRG